MADVKKAAQWLREGKPVRRLGWKPSESMPIGMPSHWALVEGEHGLIYDSVLLLPVWMLVDSLLAEDWEIAE